MTKQLLIACILLLARVAFAAEPQLFQLSVSGERVGNGKTLTMSYQELSRDVGSSVVEVIFVSGGSVSASMFTLRGSCALALARGEQFFRVVTLSRKPIRFELHFLAEASETQRNPVNKAEKVFSRDECNLLGF